MATVAISPIPIVIFGVALIIVAVFLMQDRKRHLRNRQYQSFKSNKYVPGQFSPQMELDMRLPYRRFKQLYPSNRWTYEEFKQMQKKTAFRRSTSSEQNKRMVR